MFGYLTGFRKGEDFMPRIPEETIERLKREISVERLAEARGVNLTRHGADLIGLCPFHDDREPSLVISPKKNLWHCLGACNAGGTAIDWVMKAEGVSFRHAVELLRADVAVGESPVVKVATIRKLPPPVDRSADDAAMLEQVVAYYHETLKQSPEALKYLESRGLTNPELIDTFRLGYANRTLGLRLPAKNRKAGDEMRTRLQTLGIIRESGHEHFNGSLTIPVFDNAGAVVGMYGRKITEYLREGTPLHLYLPGDHHGVFNEKALAASKDSILCESLIDALTFWSAGFRNVTASYGVNGFTDDHREAFRRHGVARVWIAYDRDEAGEKAAETLAPELMAMGIDCYRVLFPKGMDANEYALKVTPAEKSLGLLLNKAEWMGKGKRALPDAKQATKEKTNELAEETVFPLAAPASVSVAAKELDVAAEVRGEEIVITLGERQGERRYRVRGLQKNLSYDMLRVNVLVTRRSSVDNTDIISMWTR